MADGYCCLRGGNSHNKISSVKYNYMINKYVFLCYFIKLSLHIVPVSYSKNNHLQWLQQYMYSVVERNVTFLTNLKFYIQN